MSPQNIVKLCIGGACLLGTLVALGVAPKERRKDLMPFGIIGIFFVISGLLP